MKCPYCSSEMEQGCLRSRGGVFFLPDGEKMPRLYTQTEMHKHRAILFPPDLYALLPEYPTAYICRCCGKLLMEFGAE